MQSAGTHFLMAAKGIYTLLNGCSRHSVRQFNVMSLCRSVRAILLLHSSCNGLKFSRMFLHFAVSCSLFCDVLTKRKVVCLRRLPINLHSDHCGFPNDNALLSLMVGQRLCACKNHFQV
ncbi:uncharacterized protein LOC131033819 isoform X2 [Cryptomeria japonica]|uniref:uncharacterized protein LOC131033819 isoform X2 n=1 Tax=Cryptomeria japonica TaxID=3369 RepID=UPI0027DA811C|nr:uncharacterized protein LOC131033819 isoform X2 [Cryptomeria japonica]